MIAQIAGGVLAADFATAVFHWFEDTYLPYTTSRGLWARIARDNELHHAVPFAITSGSRWDNVRDSTLAVALLILVVFVVRPAWILDRPWFWGAFASVAATSNLLHRFQHERDCTRPRLVTWLQNLGVLCSRSQHSAHHAEPEKKYAVVLGWTNAVYDALGVWVFLETVLKLVGMRPAKKASADSYADVRDSWLDRNLSRECPDRIPRNRLDAYRRKLHDKMTRL